MEGRDMVSTRKKFVGKALMSVLALTVLVTGMFVLTGTAMAQEGSSSITCELDPYASVCKGEQDKDFDPGSSSRLTTEPDDTLPFTGADVTLFVITGAALVATGMLVVRRTRANRSEAQ